MSTALVVSPLVASAIAVTAAVGISYVIASATLVNPATLLNGGNKFAKAAQIGTLDANDVNIITNGTSRIKVNATTGAVAIAGDTSINGTLSATGTMTIGGTQLPATTGVLNNVLTLSSAGVAAWSGLGPIAGSTINQLDTLVARDANNSFDISQIRFMNTNSTFGTILNGTNTGSDVTLALPSVSGDTLISTTAAQSLSNKTLLGATITGNVTQTGSGTFTSGTGLFTASGPFTVSGLTTLDGNVTQSGAGTLTTGTGLVTVNGSITQSGAGTITTGTGLLTSGGGIAFTNATTSYVPATLSYYEEFTLSNFLSGTGVVANSFNQNHVFVRIGNIVHLLIPLAVCSTTSTAVLQLPFNFAMPARFRPVSGSGLLGLCSVHNSSTDVLGNLEIGIVTAGIYSLFIGAGANGSTWGTSDASNTVGINATANFTWHI